MYIFPNLSRILPFQVRQRLFTITLNNLHGSFPPVVKYFSNRADKKKNTVNVLCLNFFGHALLYYNLITAKNKNNMTAFWKINIRKLGHYDFLHKVMVFAVWILFFPVDVTVFSG